VLPQDQVPAKSQLIVEYSARRRRDDLLGLGLLTLITMLSFTGIVELSREMHPIRFLLVLAWAWSSYRVLTRSLLRVRFTATGIEGRGAFGKTKRWRYDDLAEIRRAKGERGAIRLRFRDGSVLKLDYRMTHSAEALAMLEERAPHLTATLA
jgi:hypothetical protein